MRNSLCDFKSVPNPMGSPRTATQRTVSLTREEANRRRKLALTPNPSFMAFGVVLGFCSSTTSPAPSRTQYQLVRSPRSNPMVSF